MTPPISESLFQKIVLAFLTQDKFFDDASFDAMKTFIVNLEIVAEKGPVNYAATLAVLDNPAAIASLIEDTREVRRSASNDEVKEKWNLKAEVLGEYEGKIKTEFRKHGISTETFDAQAETANPFVKYIANRIMETGSLKNIIRYGVGLAFVTSIVASATWDGIKWLATAISPTTPTVPELQHEPKSSSQLPPEKSVITGPTASVKPSSVTDPKNSTVTIRLGEPPNGLTLNGNVYIYEAPTQPTMSDTNAAAQRAARAPPGRPTISPEPGTSGPTPAPR